jgi:hypothetical protein
VKLPIADYGQSMGLSDSIFKNVVHINIEVCVGDIVNAVITSYTECKTIEELLATFPESLREAEIRIHSSPDNTKSQFNLWSIRMPVTSISVGLLPPYIKRSEETQKNKMKE